MSARPIDDEASQRSLAHFRAMVESVGVKSFAESLGLSTRQVNRILAGVQPNPVDRLLRTLQSCIPEVGDKALDYVCQEMGGVFVREEGSLDDRAVNAVKECAEAIAAISDGEITRVDEGEIREAISALVALSTAIQERRAAGAPAESDVVRVEVNTPLRLRDATQFRLRR